MEKNYEFLKEKAYKLRIDSLKATTLAKSGHPTSCLSAAEIMSVLFFKEMKFDLNNFHAPNNDKFILSKGHAAPILYAAWYELGKISEEEFFSLRKFNSQLEGHPTPRFPYVDLATGSLGIGLSSGIAMALTAKLDKKDFYTYVLMGDSETTEGSVWEAAELASFYKLNNLIGIIDVNSLGQADITIDDYNLEKIKQKWEAFGWQAIILNGHDIGEIIDAFNIAKKSKNSPSILIAKTSKGHGLPSIENKMGYHGKAFTEKEYLEKLEELKKQYPEETKIFQEQNLPNQLSKNFTEIKNQNSLESQSDQNISNYQESNIKDDFFRKLAEKLSKINYDSIATQALKSLDLKKDMATRKAFGDALLEYGKHISEIVCLDGEVKNSTFTEIFEKEFPERFFECYIAEQCMLGMATGFAAMGKVPFAATFGAFLTRAHDQIRMAAISRKALKIVGSHAGVAIGEDGPSQMALEDIAMMRAIPNSIVICPSDAVSAYKLTGQIIKYCNGISYLRTARNSTPIIYDINEKFDIGQCKILKQSEKDKACIIATGITVFEALKAYETLKKDNIYVSIIDCYSIKPLDIQTIIKVAKISGKIITVEDHYIEGGLGETVCAELKNNNFKIEMLAVKKIPMSGTAEELLNYEEINAKKIIEICLNF